MTEKRYSHDAIVIVDHLKKDLIYIDGNDELLELAEYVDRLQEENEQLKKAERRLYKYFRKCFDNVSEQGFRETWEVVKKYD